MSELTLINLDSGDVTVGEDIILSIGAEFVNFTSKFLEINHHYNISYSANNINDSITSSISISKS
jgi:hypothetical protein